MAHWNGNDWSAADLARVEAMGAAQAAAKPNSDAIAALQVRVSVLEQQVRQLLQASGLGG